MTSLIQKVQSSLLLVRAVPFVIFITFTMFQGKLFPNSQYWIYLIKSLAGAWLLWIVWPHVSEMRWKISWEAVIAGIGVFVMWVGLDPYYPRVDEVMRRFVCPVLTQIGLASWCPSESTERALWNPFAAFPTNTALAWLIVAGRIIGSSLVVPPLEEVFYRSFLYRYIVKPDFQNVPLNQFRFWPFLATAAVFGFAHFEWLAGILCAFAYHGLIFRHNRLGDAMTAHAITNFLLGVWVVWKGQWQFW
jgi:membrane protease YdiL (CAAX protease family)